MRTSGSYRGSLWSCALALGSALTLVACTGEITGDAAVSQVPVVEQRLPRLSHLEWERTVVDLFGLAAPTGLSASFASDALAGAPFDNDRGALGVSPSLSNDYRDAAEALAARVTADPALLAHVVPGDLPAEPSDKVRAFVRALGLKAFRRPLLDSEVAEREQLFASGPALYPELDPFVAGVRLSIAAFLQSPYFLYRTELSPAAEGESAVHLSGFELASRLSYALWNSMPDQELFRAAGAGELEHDESVRAQVERMIDAPQAHVALRHFFEQLYQAEQYRRISKDITLYPSFTPELATDMRGELTRFTDDVYQRGGGLRELLTSTTTFVTARLAPLYGLSAATLTTPDAEGFSRVQLDPAQRSGLLTRSGFLAWKGTDTQPNTIQRGVFIVRRITCQPLGNPPASAQGATFGKQSTNRKRIEALTGPGTCGGGCHGPYINPAGFAFEHYGALGEYRSVDGAEAIDSSGTLSLASGAVPYRDATELSRGLAESPEAHACFTQHLLQYLVGHQVVAGDDALAAELARRSLAGAPTRELVLTVLESEALRVQPLLREAP